MALIKVSMGLCDCYEMLWFRVFDLGQPFLETKKRHALSRAPRTRHYWLDRMNDTLASRMSSSGKHCIQDFQLTFAKANNKLRVDETMVLHFYHSWKGRSRKR